MNEIQARLQRAGLYKLKSLYEHLLNREDKNCKIGSHSIQNNMGTHLYAIDCLMVKHGNLIPRQNPIIRPEHSFCSFNLYGKMKTESGGTKQICSREYISILSRIADNFSSEQIKSLEEFAGYLLTSEIDVINGTAERIAPEDL